jgi:DNA repair exonuclease SbcCD ATPase subunit
MVPAYILVLVLVVAVVVIWWHFSTAEDRKIPSKIVAGGAMSIVGIAMIAFWITRKSLLDRVMHRVVLALGVVVLLGGIYLISTGAISDYKGAPLVEKITLSIVAGFAGVSLLVAQQKERLEQRDLREARRQLQSVMTDTQGLREQIQALQSEHDTLLDQLSRVRSDEEFAALQETQQELNAQIQELNAQIRELERQKEQQRQGLQSRIDTLQGEQQQTTEEQQQLRLLREQIRAQQQTISDEDREIATLQTTEMVPAEIDSMEASIMKTLIRKLENEKKELEAERDRYKGQLLRVDWKNIQAQNTQASAEEIQSTDAGAAAGGGAGRGAGLRKQLQSTVSGARARTQTAVSEARARAQQAAGTLRSLTAKSPPLLNLNDGRGDELA